MLLVLLVLAHQAQQLVLAAVLPAHQVHQLACVELAQAAAFVFGAGEMLGGLHSMLILNFI